MAHIVDKSFESIFGFLFKNKFLEKYLIIIYFSY